ncbi:hypothetical protein KCMC57_up63440 [Kitasatospora sp. CMC57]|uniref:Serine dehydrogenase proteinase n=2 Tax=Kitasatospora sp. CMC57 TaxID=3231513 RepID=A0AB33K300_9ACTN
MNRDRRVALGGELEKLRLTGSRAALLRLPGVLRLARWPGLGLRQGQALDGGHAPPQVPAMGEEAWTPVRRCVAHWRRPRLKESDDQRRPQGVLEVSIRNSGSEPADDRETALDVGMQPDQKRMRTKDREAVLAAGKTLEDSSPGTWLLISGEFTSDSRDAKGTEGQVRDLLQYLFKYPTSRGEDDPSPEINVLVDSVGGSLDSAYTAALYLTAYSSMVRVYVPRRAKSASTLLALGSDELYLSPFGELGPLDTRLSDPRNPARNVSALDCYQSVDYVRDFGIRAMRRVMPALIDLAGHQDSATALMEESTRFALGAITPLLQDMNSLDLGAWGRSLRIGERYTRKLLEAKPTNVDQQWIEEIARKLVFDYTHHYFPIDYREAERLGLPVAMMDEKTYFAAAKVVDICQGKNFVGFISKKEVAAWNQLVAKMPALADAGPSADGREAAERRALALVDDSGGATKPKFD